MTTARSGSLAILFTLLGTSALLAGDFSTYRGLKFGMNLAAASKVAGTRPNEVRQVRQRPALIQEMDWQPRSLASVDLSKADPVKEGLLSFFNGDLFRIEVTYDRYKVEGMSVNDMTEAISATYGSFTKPVEEIAYHSIYGETASVVARWEDAEYSYSLVRTGDRTSFALILVAKKLNTLAQAAITEAVRIDAQEAPQREIARQEKRDQEERLILDKARSTNKPNFRP